MTAVYECGSLLALISASASQIADSVAAMDSSRTGSRSGRRGLILVSSMDQASAPAMLMGMTSQERVGWTRTVMMPPSSAMRTARAARSLHGVRSVVVTRSVYGERGCDAV